MTEVENVEPSVPPDPLQSMTLTQFAGELRSGEFKAEHITSAYLQRIAELDGKIGAFRNVAGDRALAAARGIDALLEAGTDLGPLMGVPIAVKEIFATNGFPFGAGTELDLRPITPPQGEFMQNLRRAGCVILGTTATTEFAAATINLKKPMPWNPVDPQTKRVCGGSSHGSAAAMSAGLCAFSVGSDTGGSVRLPAALCGVFGYKSTAGLWPTAGVFSLSPTMDSIGIFTRFAEDAALVFATLAKDNMADLPRATALRVGKPRTHFFEQLDAPVRLSVEVALGKLRAAGAEIVDIEVPDIEASMPGFTQLLFADFVSVMGHERLRAGHATMDPVPWARIETSFGVEAETLVALRQRQRQAVSLACDMMSGVDALVTPTTPFCACPVDEVGTLEKASAWNLRSGRNTRPGNYFGQCGTTIPIQQGSDLPIGLQIICRPGADSQLLAISRTIEAIVGSKSHH